MADWTPEQRRALVDAADAENAAVRAVRLMNEAGAERDMALRMHQVQLERANRLDAEVETLRKDRDQLRRQRPAPMHLLRELDELEQLRARGVIPPHPVFGGAREGGPDLEAIKDAAQGGVLPADSDVLWLVGEIERLRAEDTRLRGVIAGELVRDGQAIEADHREIVGYVLVDPNTNAMDWDGLIHDTRDGAIKEAVGTLHLDDVDKERPCCGADLWYEVGEVRRPAGLNEAVLAAAQAEWDRHRAEFLNG